ncbi:MAG: C1 family peptidase [Alphaproteobacteria bacterium]|nr:C1 family peptidase [Alphaproteobacteria bacterium]
MEVTVECDLRHQFGPARDQGARPTCMAFAASDAHAAARSGWVPLSCEYAYFHALKRDGGYPDDGTTPGAMLAAIKENGQPPETAWPYLSGVPSNVTLWKPPANVGTVYRRASAHDSASLAAIRKRLDTGLSVIVMMSLSDAFYRPDANGIIDAAEPPDPQRRHAAIAVGYGTRNGRRLILVRNSWGADWGVDGYAWVSEDYLAPRLYGFAEMKEDMTNVSADSNAANMRSSVA